MTLHPQLREALARIRAAGEANWYVLTAYILHANLRGRAWPSLDTLSRETGYGRPAVIAARQWLVRQGALARVNYALRIGDERINPRKEVMQITGMIAVDDRMVPYLTAAQSADISDAPSVAMGPARIPIHEAESPGVTPEGHLRIPEDTAATAAADQPPAGDGHAPREAGPAYGVYQVWEQEARQTLTPLLGEILGELVETHGAARVVEAVREAVRVAGPGRFSVKYVLRILERWAKEGAADRRPKRHRKPRPVKATEGRRVV